MSRRKKPPKYCRQRERGRADRAIVSIDGKRVQLGVYGSPESRAKYNRLIAEAESSKARFTANLGELSVLELVDRYLPFAEEYYGGKVGEYRAIVVAMRPLVKLYGEVGVSEFRALAVKAVRERIIEHGLVRRSVNQMVRRITRMFRWGVENELVHPDTFASLKAVPGLRRGRCAAPEGKKVLPVPQDHIDAVERHLSPQIWGLIQLQLATGARPGELLQMRRCDVDTGGRVWTYTPPKHKTEHHGHTREIYLGPAAQNAVHPFMTRGPGEYLFSPKESAAWWRGKRHAERRTPLSCGNKPKAEIKDTAGEYYDVPAYRRAIGRACKRAGVPAWTPHRLRHSAATRFRKEGDAEVAQMLLGHAPGSAITAVYAEADRARALAAAERLA